MGHLIPAGTGLPVYRKLRIDTLGAAAEKVPLEEAAERIEGVALPTPELSTDSEEKAVPDADAVEPETETTEKPDEETG